MRDPEGECVVTVAVGKPPRDVERLTHFRQLFLYDLAREHKGLVGDVVVVQEPKKPLQNGADARYDRCYPCRHAGRSQDSRRSRKCGSNASSDLVSITLVVLPELDHRADLSVRQGLRRAVLTPD